MCDVSVMRFRLLSFYTLLYRNKSKLSMMIVRFFTKFARYSDSIQNVTEYITKAKWVKAINVANKTEACCSFPIGFAFAAGCGAGK